MFRFEAYTVEDEPKFDDLIFQYRWLEDNAKDYRFCYELPISGFPSKPDEKLLVMYRVEGDSSIIMQGFALLRINSGLESLSNNLPTIEDNKHRPVVVKEAKKFEGFRDYSRGQVCNLRLFETFVRGKGLGSIFMRYIQEQGHSLIWLNDHCSTHFYDHRGFVDSGLRAVNTSTRIMVWNNPAFRANEPDNQVGSGNLNLASSFSRNN